MLSIRTHPSNPLCRFIAPLSLSWLHTTSRILPTCRVSHWRARLNIQRVSLCTFAVIQYSSGVWLIPTFCRRPVPFKCTITPRSDVHRKLVRQTYEFAAWIYTYTTRISVWLSNLRVIGRDDHAWQVMSDVLYPLYCCRSGRVCCNNWCIQTGFLVDCCFSIVSLM